MPVLIMTPYLKLYEAFSETLDEVKKRQGKVFIEDINKRLSEYLQAEIVPDIYCRLGETIFHFLIDEFQDTAPIQWQNLLPLIGNVLAQEGSLFVVGDTKQAIYGFRDADYTIMKGCESRNPFPSAVHQTLELETNYRSASRILEFNEEVFKETGSEPRAIPDGSRTERVEGLCSKTSERDRATPDTSRWRGSRGMRSDPPERLKVQTLIEELAARGYPYRDIAILTSKNREVVDATTWLSEKDIPFISYSSLDIRRRKVTGEVIALLRFLDSPPDDLAFATFLLGEIFNRDLRAGVWQTSPKMNSMHFSSETGRGLRCTKSFRRNLVRYGRGSSQDSSGPWDIFPSMTLSRKHSGPSGPLRRFEEDEATLVKILEAVKEFEGSGSNSLKGFSQPFG